MLDKATIDINEAAAFLGFKGTVHLREKAKLGMIPGAFKISNRWMFFKDELVNYARNFYKNLSDANGHAGSRKSWPLAKRKIAHTTTHVSRSAEFECKNQLDALQKETRKNMRKRDEEK